MADAAMEKKKARPAKKQAPSGPDSSSREPSKGGGFLEMVKPPLALMVICLVSAFLLIATYQLTYVDTEGVITPKLQAACQEVMGGERFTMLDKETLFAGRISSMDSTFKKLGLHSILVREDLSYDEPKQCALELTADGYAKGGLHLLVGIQEDGSITGVSVISIGETPGLGSKVQDKKYLEKYNQLSIYNVEDDIANPIPAVDNITGATYSSKGMKKAVASALEFFDQYKGVIFNEAR